jgi:hypothetical protein
MASMLTTRPLRVTHSEDTQHAGWPAIPEPLCRTYSVPDACAQAVNDTTCSWGWGKPCDGTAHPSTYSKRCTRSYHARSPRPLPRSKTGTVTHLLTSTTQTAAHSWTPSLPCMKHGYGHINQTETAVKWMEPFRTSSKETYQEPSNIKLILILWHMMFTVSYSV